MSNDISPTGLRVLAWIARDGGTVTDLRPCQRELNLTAAAVKAAIGELQRAGLIVEMAQ